MTRQRTLIALLGLAGATTASVACSKPAESNPPQTTMSKPAQEGPYLERREAHQTQLLMRGPITQEWSNDPTPEGATRVEYPSGERSLWGWMARPATEAPAPALVYFHGDFGLTAKQFAALQPFVDRGVVVLAPTLRGRNGNAGDHELVYGEVDDARAAITWLAAQPGIDASHIYTFGHSMGGGTSAMLALYPDLPVAITGSCGGIYSTETFVGWSKRPGSSDLVRFDVGDAEELELRVLSPHADQLVHPHVAFLGDQEASFRRNAQAVADAAGPDVGFRVVEVPGDHLNALAPALAGFLDIVAADAGLP